MQLKKTWVVANGTIARIFGLSKGRLTEFNVLTHPETRMHGHDLVTDRPGQSFGSSGFGRYVMKQHTLPQRNEAEHFAKEVAQYLDLHHLHAELLKSIVSEVDKDLVEENPLQIRSYLA